jgi:hypothetical protein
MKNIWSFSLSVVWSLDKMKYLVDMLYNIEYFAFEFYIFYFQHNKAFLLFLFMSEYCFLFAIYSCKKNLEKANLLYSLLKNKLDLCNIVIVYGDPDILDSYRIDMDKYLVLKCGDGYEDLSQKTLLLFKTVFSLFYGFKGLFKCDDDIIPNINHLNSHIQYLLENDIPYSGNCCNSHSYISESHFYKPIPDLFRVPYLIPECSYCPGPIYYVGHKALDIFFHQAPVTNFFEDVMIGSNLNRFSIYPDHVDLFSNDFSENSLISTHIFDRKLRFIYVQLHGRLGNWLFQIFSAYGIAKRSGRALIIFGDDEDIPELFRGILLECGVFYVYRGDLDITNFVTYDETNENDPTKNCFEYNENLVRDDKDLFLCGYFQNEKYFKDYKTLVYKILENDNICARLLKMYPDLPNSYFIHIRRGDYVGSPLYEMDSDFYYRGAILYILDKDPNARFFVVSDDIEYCKTYSILSSVNATFIEGLGPIYTLYLMSLCSKGGICANSSFSWWGSYLNKSEDKTVIMPKQWINLSKPIDIYYENVVTL